MTDVAASSGRAAKDGPPACDDPPFLVLIEPTGDRAYADTAEDAIFAARTLLDEAREEQGAQSPYARLYGDGRLVRDRVRRTDLATALGRCWCARGALRRRPSGLGFCCAEHEVLWREWDDDLRARTIVAQFIYLHRPERTRR